MWRSPLAEFDQVLVPMACTFKHNGIDLWYQSQIVCAFETAGKLSSCVELLNYRLVKKGYQPIKCGIGIAYGRALMIKAGAKGSGVNDVVWMGHSNELISAKGSLKS